MTRRLLPPYAPKLSTCALSVLALLMGGSSAARASVLTFDQIRVGGIVESTISGNAVPQDYGDRVTGSPMDVSGGEFTYGNLGEGFTPNVVVEYFGGSATPVGPAVALWTDLYGDLENVLFGNQNSGTMNILFTADPGFTVQLYGFDLGGWPSADYTIAGVSVFDGGTTRFSQSNVLVEGNASGPRHTSFEFAVPLAGSQLLVQVDYSNLPGNQQDNIGIDNVRFGQSPPPGPGPGPGPVPVPEPSTGLLLAISLAGLALRRRVAGR